MPERFTEASAAEMLSRGHVLTPEFAGQLNPFLGSLPDNYPIASLLKIFKRRNFAPRELKVYEAPNPPQEWYDLMINQDHKRQVQMGLVLERMTWIGLRTVGGIRRTFVEPDWRIRGVGSNVGQPFAYLAFKSPDPQIPENLTLGL